MAAVVDVVEDAAKLLRKNWKSQNIIRTIKKY